MIFRCCTKLSPGRSMGQPSENILEVIFNTVENLLEDIKRVWQPSGRFGIWYWQPSKNSSEGIGNFENLFIYLYTTVLCVLGESMTPHPSFPPGLFLYVNLGVKGAQKLFKTLASQLTVLGPSLFSDAYSHTLHPIDLNNIRSIPRE
jgi:hypothetical protein